MRKTAAVSLVVCAVVGLATATVYTRAAGRPGRPQVTRVPYTLSVRFTELLELRSVRGSQVLLKQDHDTIFTGRSSRFLVARLGSGRHTRYETVPALTPIVVRGSVDYLGTGFTLGLANGQPCQVGDSFVIPGDKSARAQLSLFNNRLTRLSISSYAAVVEHSKGCGVIDTTSPWGWGPINSPTEARVAAMQPRLGAIDPKSVKFGRTFTLVRTYDPINDPTLSVHTTSGSTVNDTTWRYKWTLRFIRVKHR